MGNHPNNGGLPDLDTNSESQVTAPQVVVPVLRAHFLGVGLKGSKKTQYVHNTSVTLNCSCCWLHSSGQDGDS